MYLHLGQGTVVKTEDIIGIFDMDTSTVSLRTRQYLSNAEKRKEVINITDELPKTFIVTVDKDNNKKVYLSQLSSSTLLKRNQNVITGIK